jgi:CHAD domain-containing protein
MAKSGNPSKKQTSDSLKGDLVPLSESPQSLKIRSDDSFAEAGRKVLLSHVQSMKSNEFAAAVDRDIEGVHQMRVATRKFRSAYSIFNKAFPKSFTRTIYKPMKRTAAVLGAVRDADVLLAKLDRYIEFNNINSQVLQPLRSPIMANRRKARRALMLWLDSQSYSRFLHDAHLLLSVPLTKSKPIAEIPGRTIGVAVPILIYTRIAEVRDFALSIENFEMEQYHDLRLLIKKLRYTLESLSSLLNPGGALLVAQFKAVQDVLGDMNDADVMLNFVREIESQQSFVPNTGWNGYKDNLYNEIQMAEAACPPLFERAFNSKGRKTIAKVIGEI